jgi:hypothetical protein
LDSAVDTPPPQSLRSRDFSRHPARANTFPSRLHAATARRAILSQSTCLAPIFTVIEHERTNGPRTRAARSVPAQAHFKRARSDNFRRREASWSAVVLHRFSPACESTRQRCVHSASSSLRLSNIFLSFVTFCKSAPLIQETDGQKVTTFLSAIQLPAPPSKSAGAPAHSKTLARAPITFAIAKPLGLRAFKFHACFFAGRSNAERSLTTHAKHILSQRERQMSSAT